MGTLAESDHIMAFQRTLRRPDQRLRDLSLPEMGTRLAVVDLPLLRGLGKKKKSVYLATPTQVKRDGPRQHSAARLRLVPCLQHLPIPDYEFCDLVITTIM